MSRPGRAVRLALAALGASLALVGCAQFPDAGQRQFHDKPDLGVEAVPQPRVPGLVQPGTPGAPPSAGPPAAPVGCTDPDPQVVATCVEPISAVAVLPGGTAALVGERTTGRVLRVTKDQPAVQVAALHVDPAADGGLTGLTLSPSYPEDELIYAYLTTATDNEVVRIAPGDVPKPVLTGIPRGATGNAGAITVDGAGALLVATGDAGNPTGAAGRGSLAGRLLRIDTFGKPAKGNPDPGSPVFSSGLRSPRGVCTDPASGAAWVTDRSGIRDELYRVVPGPLGPPAWTWPDRPGVAGCAASAGMLVVALTGASGLYVLHPSPDGAFTGTPETVLSGTYGRLAGTGQGSDGLIWLGTANKGGGGPVVSSDDRVVRIQPPAGGGSGVD